ncbi:MAG: nucleotidyltransferase domain-containing protein, partial [Chloroflexi bacterium]|nr:nucleotidyltransferase domain-containing protein [Chloroflexota bacterium]
MLRDYPGTPQHRALLRAIVSYYNDDPRVLAISIFGSLVRGTWHRYSDLDLDVVTADGITIDPYHELMALCGSLAAIHEHAALIVPDGAEACDVVLESLLEFSIRYHPLQTTSPNIVDSLRVLAGRIDQAAILAAGQANGRMRVSRQPAHILDQCVRYVVGADVALQRRQLWGAIELLHRARGLLMELFARTRDQVRTYQV